MRQSLFRKYFSMCCSITLAGIVVLGVVFMVFAALSTVLGVCENILAMVRELTGWSRPKGCVVCGVGIFLLARRR